MIKYGFYHLRSSNYRIGKEEEIQENNSRSYNKSPCEDNKTFK
jgi:hypothetical protein